MSFIKNLLCAFCLSAMPAQASVVPQFFVNGDLEGRIQGGSPADWQWQFYYMATGQQVTNFEPWHTKYMHLFVVSQDLMEFSHLHPLYDAANHRFQLTINSAPIDADNFSQAQVARRRGEYYVITEVKLRGLADPIHGMHSVDSDSGDPMQELPAIEMRCDGQSLMKHVDEEGNVQEAPSFYQVAISCLPDMLDDFPSATFTYAWRYWDGDRYRPVTDFVPWLHMTGHAMAASLAGEGVGAKTFRHMHAMSPSGSSAPIVFQIDKQHGSLPDGAYKIWAQFKRGQKVLTLPVVVDFRQAGFPQ